MPQSYDDCVQTINKKIREGRIPKSFQCDSKGKSNKDGRKKCRTSAYAICSRLKSKEEKGITRVETKDTLKTTLIGAGTFLMFFGFYDLLTKTLSIWWLMIIGLIIVVLTLWKL